MARRDASVEITAGAERDLAGIYQRRLTQRGSDGEDGADALLGRLIEAIESLAQFPDRGPVPPELEALGIGIYRQLSIAPYRVIYLPREDHGERRVTIMIVADSRRDFQTLLQERLSAGG